MASPYLQLGTKRTNIRSFLKDASSQNSIKYKAERKKTHVIYFPYQMMQNEETGETEKTLIALSAKVHEWTSNDGKYHATMCTQGKIIPGENGVEITDGSCPFCDRISDSWDIYRYRYDLEERSCGKTGDELKKHMDTVKSQFLKERKTSDAKDQIYILIVLFKTDEKKNPVLGSDDLPSYELKIMKMSAAGATKLEQQMENNGISLEDAEVIFSYPDEEDIRLLVNGRTTTAVFPSNKITAKYPAILEKISKDVEKFDWDGIDKAFPEWTLVPTNQSKKTVKEMFRCWDQYLEDKEVNGDSARYLEYMGKGKEVTQPSIDGSPAIGTGVNMGVNPPAGGMPQIGSMPQMMGGMPQMGSMPQMPSMGQTIGGMPTMGNGMTGNGEVDI